VAGARRGIPVKHLPAILFYLEAGIKDFGATWWEQLKKMGRSLLFPWEGMGDEIKSIINDAKAGTANLLSLNFNGAVDNLLSITRTMNGILGNWFGWFMIASMLVGGLIGIPGGAAGVGAGIGAGFAFAGEVGEGLLFALIAAEGLTIAKAGADLNAGKQSEDENTKDEKQIANSSITLGITGALVLLSGLAARFAKAVFGKLSALFKDLKAPKDLKPGDVKPSDIKPVEDPNAKGKGGRELTPAEIKAKLEEKISTKDGKHESFTDEAGPGLCSGKCDPYRRKFRDVLKDNPKLEAKITKLEEMPTKTEAQVEAHKTAREALYEELRDARLNDILSEIDDKFRAEIDNAPPELKDKIRHKRYLEKCNEKVKAGTMEDVDILRDFDDWFKKSRGSRRGGPGHRLIQNVLADPTLHPGAIAEFPVPGTSRFADVFWPRGANGKGKPTYHQIGGKNPVRGDPIARERAAIEDIRKAVGPNADIVFWDKTKPGAAPMTNPDLRPDWVPSGRGD
jgi:hypothetical protein